MTTPRPRPRSATAPTVLAAGLSAAAVLGLGLLGSSMLTGAGSPSETWVDAAPTPLVPPAPVQDPSGGVSGAPQGPVFGEGTGPEAAEPGPGTALPDATLAFLPPPGSPVGARSDDAPAAAVAASFVQVGSSPRALDVLLVPAAAPVRPVVPALSLLHAVPPPPPPTEETVATGTTVEDPAGVDTDPPTPAAASERADKGKSGGPASAKVVGPSRTGAENRAKPEADHPAKAGKAPRSDRGRAEQGQSGGKGQPRSAAKGQQGESNPQQGSQPGKARGGK